MKNRSIEAFSHLLSAERGMLSSTIKEISSKGLDAIDTLKNRLMQLGGLKLLSAQISTSTGEFSAFSTHVESRVEGSSAKIFVGLIITAIGSCVKAEMAAGTLTTIGSVIGPQLLALLAFLLIVVGIVLLGKGLWEMFSEKLKEFAGQFLSI